LREKVADVEFGYYSAVQSSTASLFHGIGRWVGEIKCNAFV